MWIVRFCNIYRHAYPLTNRISSYLPLTTPSQAFCHNHRIKILSTIPSTSLHTSCSLGKKKGAKDKTRSGTRPIVEPDSEVFDVDQFKNEIEDQLEQFKSDLSKQLSSRTSIATFESLKVDLPDSGKFPLDEIAKVTMKNPKLVVINSASFPGAVEHIMAAVEKSGLGITPQQQGNTIYLQIPIMSREQREKMAASGKTLVHTFGTTLGEVEKKYSKRIDRAEGAHECSADDIRAARKMLADLRTNAVNTAKELLKHKQEDLLTEIK